MSELSKESKELLQSSRDLLLPSTEDRARIAQRLAERLGASALLLETPAARSPEPSGGSVSDPRRWGWWKLGGAVLGVGAAALVSWFALREPVKPLPTPQPSASAAIAAAITAPDPAPTSAAPSPITSSEEASAPLPLPAAELRKKAAPARDSLSEEVALLSRATAALRAERPLEAMKALDEHQRRFPRGRLVEERFGARIPALCALGRRGEAEADLSHLSRVAPRSPHLARARAACGIASDRAL